MTILGETRPRTDRRFSHALWLGSQEGITATIRKMGEVQLKWRVGRPGTCYCGGAEAFSESYSRKFVHGFLLKALFYDHWHSKSAFRCRLDMVSVVMVRGEEKVLPDPLLPWKDWVLWDVTHLHCPTPFNSSEERLCLWPSEVNLEANDDGGNWQLQVRVFEQTWLPLPGDASAWPEGVVVDDQRLR